MGTDKDLAESFLAVDRYGEDTPEHRDMLKQARADRVQALEELIAAVRAGVNAGWSAAARHVLYTASEPELFNSGAFQRACGKLRAFIEEVKP